jgi:hypothetical protein
MQASRDVDISEAVAMLSSGDTAQVCSRTAMTPSPVVRHRTTGIRAPWIAERNVDAKTNVVLSIGVQVNDGVAFLRKTLTLDSAPAIEALIKNGAVSHFVRLLRDGPTDRIKHEAAWCLASMAAGTTEEIHIMLQSGALEVAINEIRVPGAGKTDTPASMDLIEQCIRLVGSIAAKGYSTRDTCLQHGAAACIGSFLVALMAKPAPPFFRTELGRNCTKAASDLCRNKPYPGIKTLRQIPQAMANLMLSHRPWQI